MLHSLILAITACCLTACTAIPASNLLFMVTPDRADNRITAQVVDHTAVLDVYSARGIGRATVQWIGSDYPDRILLRLHLRGLEELRFTYDDTAITLSIPSTGASAVRQSRSAVASGSREEEVVTSDSPYWMNTTIITSGTSGQAAIPLTNGWIEVEVPRHFIQTRSNGFSIAWVDFFR